MRGGKREGAGRQFGSTSKNQPRDVVKQVRWTADEWAEVLRRSADSGMFPSAYIRSATLGENN